MGPENGDGAAGESVAPSCGVGWGDGGGEVDGLFGPRPWWSEAFEIAGPGVHDVAGDTDVFGHQRVVADEVYGFADGFCCV